MKHFAGAFGLLGFVAALVVGLMGEAQVSSVMVSAAIWGGTFCILGYLLGKTALILLNEAGVPELPPEWGGPQPLPTGSETGNRPTAADSEASSDGPSEEEAASVTPRREPSEGGESAGRRGSTESRASEGGLAGDPPVDEGNTEGEGDVPGELPRGSAKRESEEIGQGPEFSSGNQQKSPIEVDEALPASGATTPQTPETEGR